MNYKLKQLLLKPMDFLYKINPELEIKLMYRIQQGKKLNLENPTTYNEKIQWLKLNYRDGLIPKLVDKFTVRQFVSDNGLECILNEIYWQGFDPSQIPYDKLPNKFVMKTTHGSGFNIICIDKNELNYKKTNKVLNTWLKTEFIPAYGEWFYGVERPRIIIEKYLEGESGKIPEDYKILCFDGVPKYIRVDTDRYGKHKTNVYDLNWNLLDDVTLEHPNDTPIDKPLLLDEMIDIARKLSEGFPHVRIDLYTVNHKIYFGEMTFTNGSGFDKIKPHEFDLELGSYIKLPIQK